MGILDALVDAASNAVTLGNNPHDSSSSDNESTSDPEKYDSYGNTRDEWNDWNDDQN